MTARHHTELFAWQLADSFKKEVFRLVRQSQSVRQNYRFRDQLINASTDVDKDIVEGFRRKQPLEFARFLDYALSSLAEAEERLRDGILLDYFAAADCQSAFVFAKRCLTACVKLKESQIRFGTTLREQRRNSRGRRNNP
jgi:four helix bundle protein